MARAGALTAARSRAAAVAAVSSETGDGLAEIVSATVGRLQAYQVLPNSVAQVEAAALTDAVDFSPRVLRVPDWERPGSWSESEFTLGLSAWNTMIWSSGRGVGKTFGGSCNVVLLLVKAVAEVAADILAGRRDGWPQEIKVFAAGPTWGHVRQVMMFEGDCSIEAVLPDWAVDHKASSQNVSTGFPCVVLRLPGVPSKVMIEGLSAKDTDRWRGREGYAAWWDEPAACLYAAECWRQFMQLLRKSEDPRLLLTCTPNWAHPSQELIWTLCAAAEGDPAALEKMSQDMGGVLGGGAIVRRQVPSWANAVMPESWRNSQRSLAATGTPWARQEVLGELAEPTSDVLIARADQLFVKDPPRDAYRRVVLGVDPATGDGSRDEWGLVCVGELTRALQATGAGGEWTGQWITHVVLSDDTLGAHPDRAAAEVARVAKRVDVDMVFVERNQGGLALASLVQSELEEIGFPSSRLDTYWSSDPKGARAEVWASRMRLRTFAFAESLRGGMLSSQAAMWSPTRDMKNSPDRVDAVGIASAWLGLGSVGRRTKGAKIQKGYRRRYLSGSGVVSHRPGASTR